MEYRKEKSHASLILILGDKRLEADRQLLIRNSNYFASLLSTNFNDYHRQEHVIKYEIPFSILQEFINWIHDDKYYNLNSGRQIKYSLAKFRLRDHIGLLKLLHLSVLFATDQLIEHIIDIIEIYWLSPKYIIDIWLVAQDLGLCLLRDVSLAVCLDCFNDLPPQNLFNLTSEEFMKLAGNSNIRSTETYLQNIILQWINFNDEKISVNAMETEELKYLHCIVYQEDSEDLDKKIHLCCYDGSQFFEYCALEYPKEIIGEPVLRGVQFTGRGYNLYLIGGEYGIGTGRFNKKIWRYSLLSKKWFYESLMPVPRRHMVAAIMKNKLLLAAGTGQYRIKMSRLDIYDFHTHNWTQGADIPETFSYIPEHIVFNGKLIIYTLSFARLFAYYIDEDRWVMLTPETSEIHQMRCVPLIPYGTDTCYLDLRHEKRPDDKFVRNAVSNETKWTKGSSCEGLCVKHYKLNVATFLTRVNSELTLHVIKSVLSDNEYIFVLAEQNQYLYSLHSRGFSVQNPERFFLASTSLPVRVFFRLMNPADLHTASNIFNREKNDYYNGNDRNQDDCKPSTSRDHQSSNRLPRYSSCDNPSTGNLSRNRSLITRSSHHTQDCTAEKIRRLC